MAYALILALRDGGKKTGVQDQLHNKLEAILNTRDLFQHKETERGDRL